MSALLKTEVLEEFLKTGSNSSHFVWLLGDLSFFRTQTGHVFGYVQVGEVTLFALEPLGPDHGFTQAWDEVVQALRPKISAFVSVYEPFCRELESMGFSSLVIGKEPWVNLQSCVPKGNAGKGVRSARNHAVRSGLSVEEWSASELEHDPDRCGVLKKLYQSWARTHWIKLTGFTLATDAFAFMRERRYFIVRSPKQIEGYLVASPIPKINSYYIEDLIMKRGAVKGAGEFLTLEAMLALGASGATQASLGVVAVNEMHNHTERRLPPLIRFMMVQLPSILKRVYNFEGMETYRKRFKPHAWTEVFLAVKVHSPEINQTRGWLQTLRALLIAFRPKWNLSLGMALEILFRPVVAYPLTWLVGSVSLLLFAIVNRWGDLPHSVLERFGFSPQAPWQEWPLRTLTSDFIYVDWNHFWIGLGPLLMVMIWMERTQKPKLAWVLFWIVSMSDDFLNYYLLLLPMKWFQNTIFKSLISGKEVGSSLILFALLGFQLCELRKHREIVFAVLTITAVLGFAFTSAHMGSVLMNLNHFFFLAAGFIAGKINFENKRKCNERASRGKTPVIDRSKSLNGVDQHKTAA